VYQDAANALTKFGFACLDQFMPDQAIQSLHLECAARMAAGKLAAAAVGRLNTRRHAPEIRGDHTQWLTDEEPALAEYFCAMALLRNALNPLLLLGLDSLQAHFALYPPGAGYARHRDRFRSDDARVLSSVLYLNPDWQPEHGGALRAHHASGVRDYLPSAGRLVLFLSDELEHEVLPATRSRSSIAAWFHRRTV